MTSLTAEHYLLDVKLRRDRTLKLHPKVIFIVGKNGSGKSTLLEAIATSWGFNPEGGTKNFNFGNRRLHSEPRSFLMLGKSVKHQSRPRTIPPRRSDYQHQGATLASVRLPKELLDDSVTYLTAI
jgi:predicted ATPase